MGSPSESIYTYLYEQLEHGKSAVLLTLLESQQSIRGIWLPDTNAIHWPDANAELSSGWSDYNETIHRLAVQAHAQGCLCLEECQPDFRIIAEPFFPQPQLIVFGGGHIALPLVDFAARTGFKVTVVDDRPKFANRARFPAAESVLCESFEKAFAQLKFHSATYAVIITRGHRYDQLCLEQVLARTTAYTGMIGSRRRLAIVFEELKQKGFAPEALAAVHAPIGLSIAAITPEEIAVSILAELIQVRRQAADSSGSSRTCQKDNDLDVLRELIAKDREPHAMATVLATKGSAPRKAGAKMLIYADGRTVGSIGGGCSEGEVILQGRERIRAGSGYRLHRVDLTGEAAEDEGMVCGGTMDVLIAYDS